MKNKFKIYFLLHSKAFWPSWKSFLETCKNDVRVETKIIYCPVKKQANGTSGQFDGTEDWLKESNIKYCHINNINLLYDRPDLLFIQTPYEGHRENKNKTDVYKEFAINMAYVSYGLEFTEATINISSHFKLSIHKNCWRIYTFCKDLIEDYWKYCPIGNSHVKCLGHPKFDALYNAKNIQMPQWLKEKINGRKIICWHPHFPCEYSTENGKKVISTFPWEENLKILEYIKNDKEHFYIFMAHHMFWGVFEHTFNISKEELEKFKKILNNGENSVIWTGEYPEVLHWSNIFMGERSAVTMEMITTQKPVIYLENCPEIYNKFGKNVINSYYYAKNAQEALTWLDKIKSGFDDKQDLRKAVFDEYFAPYWDGKCGERIKEDVLNSSNELKVSKLKIFYAYFCSFAKSVFSIRNESKTHKIIKLFGLIRIKIRRR